MPSLSGKVLAQDIRAQLKTTIATQQLDPGLAILLVGDNPASELYVRLKEQAAQEIGIRLVLRRETFITMDEAKTQIERWNSDSTIQGILIQLPLPINLETDLLIESIDPEKDVDSFHPKNKVALFTGQAKIFSPVHLAVLKLISQSPLTLNGCRTLILGKSPVFTEPLAFLLRRAGAFVDIENEKPRDNRLQKAALVITALGQAEILRGTDLHPEAVVIDISTNHREDGKLVGDFVAESVGPKQWISPVPGGVGPLTIAYLLQNTVEVALRARQ